MTIIHTTAPTVAPATTATSAVDAAADAIQANINLAKTAHIASRDSAMEAVAHTYLVWRACQEDLARDWLNTQIAAANDAILAHNKAQKELRKLAIEAMNESLTPSAGDANTTAMSADEAKKIAAEIAELVKLAGLSSKEWQARRKLLIKARRGANPFTVIVKFVMGFDSHSDASMTSRYATVLSWVDAHFAGQVVDNAAVIVDAIKAADGFEAVCRKQGKIKPETDQQRIVQAEINKSIKDYVKAASKNAPMKGVLNFSARAANDDLVVLIARQNGDQIEVITDVSVKPSDLDNIIARVDDDGFLPVSGSTEMLHRVLSLGHIVEHNKPTEATVDGTKAGATRYTERVMSLRSDAKGRAQLVLSAQYGDASAVVHVSPKAGQVNLGEVDGVFVLDAEQYAALEKKLKDRYQRRFINVQADDELEIDNVQYENCKLSWSASYSEAIDPDNKAGQTYYWSELAQQDCKPFDIENCQWQFEVCAAKSAMVEALDAYTAIVDGVVKTTFPDQVMTLACEGSAITIKSEGTADVTVPVEGVIAEQVKLTMRPQDLCELLKKLVKQEATKFTIKGDEGGVIAVFWGDALADYAIYIPTCKASMALESRRVAPMRNKLGPVVAMAQAAA